VITFFAGWRRTAWTGSTLAEIDTDTGELVTVPGHFPAQQRSFWWRLRQWLHKRLTRAQPDPLKRAG